MAISHVEPGVQKVYTRVKSVAHDNKKDRQEFRFRSYI